MLGDLSMFLLYIWALSLTRSVMSLGDIAPPQPSNTAITVTMNGFRSQVQAAYYTLPVGFMGKTFAPIVDTGSSSIILPSAQNCPTGTIVGQSFTTTAPTISDQSFFKDLKTLPMPPAFVTPSQMAISSTVGGGADLPGPIAEKFV